MEQRYKVLRIIATLYKVLAVITAVVTILAALGICVTSAIGGAAFNQSSSNVLGDGGSGALGGVVGGVIIAIGMILYGALVALALYGFGELIMVLLAIEENTRGTHLMMEQSRAV